VLQLCRSGRISWADMLLAPSVAALFKWRQFEPEMILLAVGWYLRFSLSYRDVEELLAERGLHADHVTVWRWVQRYAPEMERRLRRRLQPTNDSWRVDHRRLRRDSYDSQRPGVRECAGCEGRSSSPLHSRSVRGDELNSRLSTLVLRLDYKVATHPFGVGWPNCQQSLLLFGLKTDRCRQPAQRLMVIAPLL